MQPTTHADYFEFHGFKERYSDPGGGRFGFIELWSGPNFTGHNHKSYYTDMSYSDNPPKHVESVRISDLYPLA